MSYKPSNQMAWEKSPIYHTLIYRKDETITKESILEEFMEFVKDESEYDSSDAELAYLQNLIHEFLYNIEKVKAGELEMLEKWKASVR